MAKAVKANGRPKIKAAPKAVEAKAKTKVKAKAAKAANHRAGTKISKVIGLLVRPKGCTRPDVLQATGWPSISMQQTAKDAGLRLRTKREGRLIRYFGEGARA